MEIELYQLFEREIGVLRTDNLYKEVLISKLKARVMELESELQTLKGSDEDGYTES